MSIKNLRLSGTTVLADVVVGSNEYGSDVSVQLRLNRKDPDVVKALEPLTKLLSDTSHEYLTASVDTKFIQQQVRERTKAAVAAAEKRIAANAKVEAEREVASLKRQLSDADWTMKRLRDENARLQEERPTEVASHATEG